MRELVLALSLVAYNNLMNLWPPFNGWTYVVLNLLAGGLLVAISLVVLQLPLSDIGIRGNKPGAVLVTAAAALLVAGPLFLAAAFEPTARLLADKRAAGLTGAELAFQVLIRIPLGTALFEELAFRGVLVGALAKRGAVWASVASSVAFGLWHITPALQLVHANRPGATPVTTVIAVLLAVVLTTAAGLGLSWLRFRSGGMGAPFALHAIVNSVSLLAAVMAHRRL